MDRLRKIYRLIFPVLMILTLFVGTSRAALKAVGPVEPVSTLPLYYVDTNNRALQLCLDQNGMCLLPPPFDAIPPNPPIATTVGAANDNTFPGESFYYSAQSLLNIEPALDTKNGVGELANLAFVMEAAFLSGVFPDGGITFLRTDLQKMSNLKPFSTYRVTHPYGTFDFDTNGVGDTTGGGGVAVRLEDGPAVPAQWMPTGMKNATITGIGPFLVPANGVFPTRTVGVETHVYIGDGTPIAVTGGLNNVNYFKIERIKEQINTATPVDVVANCPTFPLAPNDPNILLYTCWRIDTFALNGRVYTGPIPSDLSFKATYARDAISGQVDVFAAALPGATLTVSGSGITTTPLTLANPANGRQFLHIPLASNILPTGLTLTNSLDLQSTPPHPVTLVDEVNITQATYNPVTKDITVKAASRDKVAAPAPTLTATNFPAPNTLTAGTLVKNITGTIPPETVTVTSSLGGSSTVPLSVVSATPAPVAANDSVTTVQNLPIVIAVLTNDIFAGTPDPASVLPVSPVNGSATANPDGTVTFTPTTGFTGTASFNYTVSDTLGQVSNSATATISVIPPPPAVAPEWVGAEITNGGVDILVWWAASPSIGATYTVFANGILQQSGISGTSLILTGLANNTSYTVSVRTDAPGASSSTLTFASTPVSINRFAAPPAWVGAQLYNAGIDILSWWPASTTPGATYTVFANGIQQQTGVTGTSAVLTGLANNTSHLITVRTDAPGYNSSSATAAASPVTINRTAAAPPWMGVQSFGTNGIKLWWPTSTIAGASYTITETRNGVVNPTPITGPFVVSGNLTVTILSNKTSGTYSYTIRTTATGYNTSAATIGAATVTLP